MVWFTAAWAAIKSLPWWAWLVFAILVAGYFYGEHKEAAGRDSVQALWDEATRKSNEQVRGLAASLMQANSRVEVITETKVQTVVERGETIIKKVNIYVPVNTPDLPAGFRLLHDAAALQTDIADSSEIASAGTVPVAAAATTIVGNYTACHKNEALLAGWQLWWQEIKSICDRTKQCQFVDEPVLP